MYEKFKYYIKGHDINLAHLIFVLGIVLIPFLEGSIYFSMISCLFIEFKYDVVMKVTKVAFKISSIYTLVYLTLGFTLNKFNILYRPWVEFISSIIVGIFIVSAIIMATNKIYVSSKILGKVVRNIFLIIVIFFIIIVVDGIHNPEKVVNRNGKLEVKVEESSFLMVDTCYYSYINLFLMGDMVIE